VSDTSARLRVLQIFSRYREYGGEEGSVYRIGDTLQSIHDVEYFLTSTADQLGESFAARALRFPRIFHNSEIARRLERFQRIGNFDLWQIHNVFPAMSPVVYQIAFERGIPIIQYLHNYRLSCTNGFFLNHGALCQRCIHGNFWPAFLTACWHDNHLFSGLMGLTLARVRQLGVFEKVARWIAISSWQKQLHIEMGIPSNRIDVVPHFFEPSSPPPPFPKDGYALFVGRLSPEKGARHLLEAWKICASSGRRLVIMGDGPELPGLKAFAHEQGLSSVAFTGFLNADRQAAIWAGAAFVVVPSVWYETFGMVVLEAWARSRPVIAHALGGLKDIIQHEHTGLLVNPGDPAALATSMNRLFDDSSLCSQLGAAGRSELEQKYTREIWLQNIKAVYNKLRSSHFHS
jgi:glycosyltransferase involved in cell wall biosynthesis